MTDPDHPAAPAALSRGSTAVVVAGNFLAYVDWVAYAALAPVLAGRFFTGDPTARTLGVFAVYGAALLLRPLGGIASGWLADRYGRRPAMLAAMGLVAVGAFLTAAAPTTAAVGAAAPVVLLVARAVSAVAFGGEWPATVTYLMETAPPAARLRYGGLFTATCVAGGLASSLANLVLSTVLDAGQLASWGWRIPFLLAGAGALALCGLRSRLRESPQHRRPSAAAPVTATARALWRGHRGATGTVALLAAAATVTTTTFLVVVPATAQERLGAAPGTVFAATFTATVVLAVLIVPLSVVAPRIGTRRLLGLTSAGFVLAVPALLLTLRPDFTGVLLAYGAGMLLSNAQAILLPAVMTRLFPAEVRATGLGLAQGVPDAVVGGATPVVATLLLDRGAGGWFAGAVAAIVLAAWITVRAALRRRDRAADRTGADQPGDRHGDRADDGTGDRAGDRADTGGAAVPAGTATPPVQSVERMTTRAEP